MTDKQILIFINTHAAELELNAGKGSPVCSEILENYRILCSAPAPGGRSEEVMRAKHALELGIVQFQEFKMKGLL